MATTPLQKTVPAPEEPDAFRPYVPAERTIPEFTVKAVGLGVALAVILGVANAYVGLRIGMTVSASIPAAVISMGILRLFRESTILENNVVQTIASAGEALAAGIIFTVPAFVLAEYWGATVPVLPVFAIAAVGGTLGVLFTIPLRRAYVVEARLPFPEGTACAEVLEVGDRGGSAVKVLVGGVITGAAYAFAQLGMRLWNASMEGAVRVGSGVAYLGANLAPILLGVGYLVGLRVAALITLGGALGWFVLIPAFMAFGGYPTGADGAPLPALTAAYTVWDQKIRLVGGGAMITGGLFTLWQTRRSLRNAVTEGTAGFGRGAAAAAAARPRTERDAPLARILPAILVLMIAVFGVFYAFSGSVAISLVASLAAATAGFFFSAVAGYMAGVVGSSHNPVSGVTIVTLIFTALLVVGVSTAFGIPLTPETGFAAALGVGAVIACAAAMAGDNLQDMKTGHVVGATPWKQQLGLVLGVGATALVAAPTLQMLHAAYTIGSPELAAPQATLMANILDGIFARTLDWNLVLIGMAIGAAFAVMGLPVMAVAVGIYLPLLLTVPILAGGLVRFAVDRVVARRRPEGFEPASHGSPSVDAQPTAEARAHARTEGHVYRNGLLFASGLIAGEAVLGVVVAPILVAGQDPGLFAPLVYGLLAGLALAAFGRGRGARWLALATAVAGVAWTTWLVATGATYAFQPGAAWPGLLVLAYVALLLAYVPLRALWERDAGDAR